MGMPRSRRSEGRSRGRIAGQEWMRPEPIGHFREPWRRILMSTPALSWKPPMSAVRFGDHVTIGGQAGRVPRADPQTHVTWPIVSGAVPQLAVGHIDRPETGPGLPDSLSRGETVVLTDGEDAV